MCVGFCDCEGFILNHTIHYYRVLRAHGCIGVGRKKRGQVDCDQKNCVDCKQANVCGSKVFCGWLRKFIHGPRDDGVEIIICPKFEVEPVEYKVYRRA